MRLWPMAVRGDGRRGPQAAVLDAPAVQGAPPALPGAPPDPILLDHAGPRVAVWSTERAMGPSELPEAESGRQPRALDEQGWLELAAAYARAANLVRDAGRTPVLAIDDDGLLQATLSPRTNAATEADRLARVLAIHRACGPVDVALCVEELCPGGLDATDGIAAARALVAQGARTIYASAGSRAFPPLFWREKGGTVGDAGLALSSAAWLGGRVTARIVALLVRGDLEALLPRAHALGLDDVLLREPA